MQKTQETWVQYPGQEDPLEKEMATCSSVLAWKIPWTEEPARLESTGSPRVGYNWTHMHIPSFLPECLQARGYLFLCLCTNLSTLPGSPLQNFKLELHPWLSWVSHLPNIDCGTCQPLYLHEPNSCFIDLLCIISLVLFLWRTLTNTSRFCLCMEPWKSERTLVYHTCIPWL